MNRITWMGRLAALGLVCLCLGGCLGKAPPVERYLRVETGGGDCPGQGNAQRALLGIKTLKALENIDRPSVMTAQDRVLTPSLQLYWEGSPIDIVGQALRQGIECQSTVLAPVDYQPRTEHVAVLSGQLTAFNVEETEGGRFVVSLHLDLWTKNGTVRISTGDFNAYAPLPDFRGDTIARAASDALSRIVPKVVAWLDEGMPKLEKAARQQ